ncbi:MAG: patatin-like protein, partial [Desulforhabdus sp.]|nr:patatin-like protein [Desulforhabdus sp.]
MMSDQQKCSITDCHAPDKSREVRLGLVMYGGVSLAIYINGVAHEFFRAVRGRGVYKLIKALTDSDIVVDVISGTSAGGINGILLAYALCNKKDFSSCANLWRIDGDIRSLLRPPTYEVVPTQSLFDSEGYYQERLEAAFREMPEYIPEEHEIDSSFAELDLFVTGTDVDGNIYTQLDDAGHQIDLKDHRSVFHLKHRHGRKEPFKTDRSAGQYVSTETTFRALAKLARITSCFPAAFCPVHVSDDRLGDASVDGKLQTWGNLGKDSYFLDGGVIVNKPFTYTIIEIFYRAADRQVERKLFYVEPDPERFTQQEIASCPNFLQAIIASLIGIP